MGRKRKDGKKRIEKKTVEFSSDDERAYAKESVPDPNHEDFYLDEVDRYHEDEEKLLLSKGASIRESRNIYEEAVLSVDEDSDANDEEIAKYEEQLKKFRSHGFTEKLASDLEDDSDDDDNEANDIKAWGSQASKFYGADDIDKDEEDESGSEEDAAVLEEREALRIQKRLTEQLDDQDFGFDLLQNVRSTDGTKESVKIQMDVSKLSRKEKIRLVKQESPELSGILEEYEDKLKYLKDEILPLLKQYSDIEFLQHLMQLYIDYCANISFYLALKLRREDIHFHPVIDRICQYSKMIREQPAWDELLEKLKAGFVVTHKKDLLSETVAEKNVGKKKREYKRNQRRLMMMMMTRMMMINHLLRSQLLEGKHGVGREQGKMIFQQRSCQTET